MIGRAMKYIATSIGLLDSPMRQVAPGLYSVSWTRRSSSGFELAVTANGDLVIKLLNGRGFPYAQAYGISLDQLMAQVRQQRQEQRQRQGVAS